jgi:hypothetical protein
MSEVGTLTLHRDVGDGGFEADRAIGVTYIRPVNAIFKYPGLVILDPFANAALKCHSLDLLVRLS